jgi:NADPH:quinone reductase-like Zn-dependent oxidoreductase
MFVIQLASLSGFTVITTSSPKSFPLLKSLGATHCLDYSSPTIIQEISHLTHGQLQYLFDCHSSDQSTQTAVKCLSGAGGKIVTLLFIDEKTLEREVEVFVPLLYKISGRGFPFAGRRMEASEGDRRWGEEWCLRLGELVRGGKVKGNPVRVVGGLESVEEGFGIAREGKVHAQKLVYEVCKE